ncbi:hypothetical protein HZH66_002127 [Vespula vulgaris]|uniref:Uncharacterized protein n=1 Tax=Vespula vulgaris TaxID=7454 RepID=A0A834KJ49_VESVU|nr:hypothetical protein HZH66_002127 [Vespula vulgaris]
MRYGTFQAEDNRVFKLEARIARSFCIKMKKKNQKKKKKLKKKVPLPGVNSFDDRQVDSGVIRAHSLARGEYFEKFFYRRCYGISWVGPKTQRRVPEGVKKEVGRVTMVIL